MPSDVVALKKFIRIVDKEYLIKAQYS